MLHWDSCPAASACSSHKHLEKRVRENMCDFAPDQPIVLIQTATHLHRKPFMIKINTKTKKTMLTKPQHLEFRSSDLLNAACSLSPI